jgi:hypothetical protein
MILEREFHVPAAVCMVAAAKSLSPVGCGDSDHDPASAPEEALLHDAGIRYVKVTLHGIPENLDLAEKAQAGSAKVVRIFPPAVGGWSRSGSSPVTNVRQGQTVVILNSSDMASASSDYAKATIESERPTRAIGQLARVHAQAGRRQRLDPHDAATGCFVRLCRTVGR